MDYNLDLTDDENLDEQNPYSNISSAPVDPKLKAYLQQKIMRKDSPDYWRQVAEDNRAQTMDAARNQLYASLAKSVAQIGTVNGKTPDASPVQNMADTINSSAALRAAQNQKENMARDVKDEQLLGRIMTRESSAQNAEEQRKLKEYLAQKAAEDKSERQKSDQDFKKMIFAQNAQNKQQMQQNALAQKTSLGEDRQNKADQKEIFKWSDDLRKSLDPTGPRAGEFGKQYARSNAANRANVLYERAKAQGQPDNRQIAEYGEAMAALISNGGQSAEARVKRFIPDTSGNVKAQIEEWFTNHPAPNDQMAFMDRIKESVDGEKALADKEMIGTIRQRAKNHNLRKLDDTETENIVRDSLESRGLPGNALDDVFGKQTKNPDIKLIQNTPTQPTTKPEPGTALAAPAGGRKLIKKMVNKSQNKTRLIYDNGDDEVVNGIQ